MTSKFLLLFALLGTSSALLAQPNLPTEGSYRLDDVRQLWHNTLNAAGLTADSMSNRGQSFFDLSHCSGNFHRVQEGSQGNRLAFFTERYQHIGSRLYAYGSFHFNTARIKDRAWSDVLRSYDSNPFFSGSSIKGRYDQQDIRLKAAVATLPIGPLRYGLTLDYELGDLSRLRDPRSRSQLLQYQLTPAILYSLGKNRLGLAAFYKRRKEKIANIKTVQTDATMKYYLMSGLENVSGTTGGFSSFNREWVSHEFGTELSYALQAENLHSLTAVSIARSTENVYGTYRYEPGKYVAYRYALHSQNRLQTAHILHQLDARAQYTQAYADEYRQMLVQETDPLRGFTSYRYDRILTFKKRYQVMLLDLDLHYRANFAPTGRTLQGYAGAQARFHRTDNKHLLNESELIHSSLSLQAEGGWSFLRNRRLWVDALAGFQFSTQVSQLLANPTGEYARNVLLPDLDFYRANLFRGRIQATYHFPLVIKKVRSTFFLRAYASYLTTHNHLHNRVFGLSLGVFN